MVRLDKGMELGLGEVADVDSDLSAWREHGWGHSGGSEMYVCAWD